MKSDVNWIDIIKFNNAWINCDFTIIKCDIIIIECDIALIKCDITKILQYYYN